MDVKFKRLDHGRDLPLPSYATPGSAGMDIHAAENFKLFHGQSFVMKTGFAVEIPDGYEIQVRSKSGLAAKHGVFVLNSPGTIDSDYRGEIMVILSHAGRNGYEIQRGDKIAQLVVAPVTQARAVEVDDDLTSTLRGEGGLGSTGR